MSNCLFCNFATGKIKKEFVLETDKVMVFPDIYPVAPLHLLVVPKKHVSEFTELFRHCEESKTTKQSRKKETRLLRFTRNDGWDTWSEIMKVVLKLIKQHDLEKKGYRIVINGGGAQAINHLHIHLIGKINKDRKL